jgi:hypothetical protein
MQSIAATAFTGLALAILLAGCGRDGSTTFDASRSLEQGSASLLVDQTLPEWHPALPEGHPPVYQGGPAWPEGHPPVLPARHPPSRRGACPGGGMEGRGILPGAAETERGTIST